MVPTLGNVMDTVEAKKVQQEPQSETSEPENISDARSPMKFVQGGEASSDN